MPGPIELTLILVLGVGAIFWIFVLIDCLRYEPSGGNSKIVWTLAIVFTSWIGAVLYLAIRRPQRIREIGK